MGKGSHATRRERSGGFSRSRTDRPSPQTAPLRRSPAPDAPDAFPIVGVGASAGGLEAFTQLLEQLPADTGMAFVLIQHLDPDAHELPAPRPWPRRRRCRSARPTDGTRVEPNHVYVIPPDADIAMHGGSLDARCRARATSRAPHLPIDLFLRSLAAARGSHAIGVVLSGTASDGTEGLRAIKAENGITLAQDPRRRSSPRCRAARSRPASWTIACRSPSSPQELVRLSRHPYLAAPRRSSRRPSDDAAMLEQIFVARAKRRRRRLQRVQAADLRAAARPPDGAAPRGAPARTTWSCSSGTPDEVRALYEDVLIHVTSFFRDPEVFEALKKHVFPEHPRAQARGSADPHLGGRLLDGRRGLLARHLPAGSSWEHASAPGPDLRLGRQREGHREGARRASTPTARCAT